MITGLTYSKMTYLGQLNSYPPRGVISAKARTQSTHQELAVCKRAQIDNLNSIVHTICAATCLGPRLRGDDGGGYVGIGGVATNVHEAL